MKYIAFILLAGCSSGFAPHYELNREIYTSATYISDLRRFGVSDKWELNCNVGDCEDFSLCLMQRLGQASNMVVCKTPETIHAIVEHNGWYYDPTYGTSGKTPPCEIIGVMSYKQAMDKAAKKNKK